MIRIALESLDIAATSAAEMMEKMLLVNKARAEGYRKDLHAIVNAINMLEIQKYGEIRTKVENYLEKNSPLSGATLKEPKDD